MNSKFRRLAYQLADKHLRELPEETIIRSTPSHYGPELNDNHRLFMWNGLVDHYLELDESALYSAYTRHIKQNEPIIKAIVSEELEPELQLLVESITQALWNSPELKLYSNDKSGTVLADIPTVGVGSGNEGSNDGGVTG